jgi:hypothetical protein
MSIVCLIGHGGVKRVSWTCEEKLAIENQLKKFITMMKVPGKRACEEALQKESALKERSWKAVKYYIHNCILKNKVALRK